MWSTIFFWCITNPPNWWDSGFQHKSRPCKDSHQAPQRQPNSSCRVIANLTAKRRLFIAFHSGPICRLGIKRQPSTYIMPYHLEEEVDDRDDKGDSNLDTVVPEGRSGKYIGCVYNSSVVGCSLGLGAVSVHKSTSLVYEKNPYWALIFGKQVPRSGEVVAYQHFWANSRQVSAGCRICFLPPANSNLSTSLSCENHWSSLRSRRLCKTT